LNKNQSKVEGYISMEFETARDGDTLLVKAGRISLEISDRLFIKPALIARGRALSLVSGQPGDRPAFHATLGGFRIDDFHLDWQRVEITEIENKIGRGRLITLFADAEQHGENFYPPVKIASKVSLYFYENLPEVVIGRAEFTNLGEQVLSIDRLVSSFYRLDRRLVEPGSVSWRFASYMGAAYRWGRDYSLIWIDSETGRENFMGLESDRPAGGEGGGTPLVDLWTPECGLAVASAEPSPQWISLPVKTCSDGLVEVAVIQQPQARFAQKTTLAPGESCSTIHSALILHELDFHDALRSYGDTLRAQGVNIPLSSPVDCYRPYWKSWGFGLDFTLQQIYGAIPEIKDFGIEMAMLDDGWFTAYGDWKPNPAKGKFPGGDKDMREFVRRLKAEGLKTSIWFYPQGVSPESELAREHPEWLVMNQDGSYPRCPRSLYYLCPGAKEAVAYLESLVEKILADWDFDGLYIDTTGLTALPPCFNPEHDHSSPLESFINQSELFRAIFAKAQQIKPGAPVEMCICSLPHDPFKMPYYNVANASDPTSLSQMRRRIKVEKALRGPTFCVGDCYQIPIQEWEEWSVPESFESAVGTGAQVTTLYSKLTEKQREKWRRWFTLYKRLALSSGEYLNLYDIAFDKPEAHVVRKNGRFYYAFFAERWARLKPLKLRGLEQNKTYKVTDYAGAVDLGTVRGGNAEIFHAFAESLLLEVTPVD